MNCVKCNYSVVETTTGYAHRHIGPETEHPPEMKVVDLTDDVAHPAPHSHITDTLDNADLNEHYILHCMQVREFLRMYHYLEGFDFLEVRAHDERDGHCCSTCEANCEICIARGTPLITVSGALRNQVFAVCEQLVSREPHALHLAPPIFISRVERIMGRTYAEIAEHVFEWKKQR